MGKIVLDRNPKNYFAEVEQIAFCPSNMVPGIEASPDKMLQVCEGGGEGREGEGRGGEGKEGREWEKREEEGKEKGGRNEC